MNKWISVKERLPDENVQVIIFGEGKVRLGRLFHSSVDEWRFPSWHYPLSENRITHWMPIPAVPLSDCETRFNLSIPSSPPTAPRRKREPMAYHPLANDTGSGPEDRRAEADRILQILAGTIDGYTDKEAEFIEQMGEGGHVSPKQLFWLRDIKDKYL